MDPTHAGVTPSVRHVVAMPYPGRGHINPMMNLCKLLASRGLLITFVVTEEWLAFLGSAPAPPPNLRLCSIPNVIPSELGRATDISGFIEAVFTKMEEPFELLLDRLEPPVTGIVADTYLPWAVAVGNRRSVPVYSLWTQAAAFFSVLYHFDLIGYDNLQLSVDSPEKGDDLLEHYVPGIPSLRFRDINYILVAENPVKPAALEALSWVRKTQGVLFTSCYELEAQVIDALRAKFPWPVYPVGPSIPCMTPPQENPSIPIENDGGVDYYTWLDSQPKSSVLYVSLGSFLSVSGIQVDEIAMGLQSSGIRFLWVARGDSSRVQEMSGSNGLVVPWCEQLRVLCHSSVGAFLTHCGWNSTLEGVFSGIPFLTLPIIWDQIPNSRLIVDAWKIGLRVKENFGKEGIIGREQIAKIVKNLMDLDGVESIEMRKRAMELREASRKAIEEGGSSYSNIDAFVRELMHGQGT